ncbi:MAG: hypothetical protein PWQ91_874 [Eubacteriales bacterium]|nr:hypothetical protein [Eubacteriales bacterium]MDN5363813.1 hypothetical protein [Eubacteriales bacterium]
MDPASPWEMLSDKKIWEFLGDTNQELNLDIARLLFIELFSRIKNLEKENHTLKILLFESGYIDEEVYKESYRAVDEFIREWDEQKAGEVENLSRLGLSFADWVNFTVKGKFS